MLMNDCIDLWWNVKLNTYLHIIILLQVDLSISISTKWVYFNSFWNFDSILAEVYDWCKYLFFGINQTFILRVLFGCVCMPTKKWCTETSKNYASQNIQFICKHIENLISSNASMILNLFDELERHVYIFSVFLS